MIIISVHHESTTAGVKRKAIYFTNSTDLWEAVYTDYRERYSDGRNGRCAIGVIMSYHGWNGKDDSQASGKLFGALIALRYAGIDKNLLIDLNDSGFTFDEIVYYLERNNEIRFGLIESEF